MNCNQGKKWNSALSVRSQNTDRRSWKNIDDARSQKNQSISCHEEIKKLELNCYFIKSNLKTSFFSYSLSYS